MKPVDQTTFYDPEAPPRKQRGNCLTAVVASLLELPIDSVPNFVQDHLDHDGDSNKEWDWWYRTLSFVEDHGWEFCYLEPVECSDRQSPGFGFRAPEPGEFYTVSGISPRDSRIHHIVIYCDGKMVHDPHPDRTGLTLVDDEYHWTVRKMSNV